MNQWLRFAAVLAGGLASAYVLVCWRLGQRLPRGADLAMDTGELLAALPAGFLLGTATSAHQIEGGNDGNDWARFEKEPGRIARGERSGRAVDHWNRWESDLSLMQKIGANAYRFSIEWSRVEPHEGSWDDAAWSRYRAEVEGLRAAGIVPMVTLLHFTLPAWLADRGGVTAADFPAAFGRLAAEAGRRLGDQVDLWCTLNEPNVQMYNGYVVGQFPPAMRSNAAAVQAFAGLLRAHGAAARALRSASAKARIGLAMNLVEFEPQLRYSLLDWAATLIADQAFNWAFGDSIAGGRIRFRAPGFPSVDEAAPELAGSLDFFGVNYYRRELVHFSLGAPGMVRNGPGPGDRNDMGWEIFPAGLTRLIEEAHARYRLPLYVTENGMPDASGRRNGPFLGEHVAAVARAVRGGADVRGYFYWSLLDNFEWTDGFDPRFGLYRVDYATQERSPTSAAGTFAALARQLR